MQKKAIVLLSGGLDSTVCSYLAKNQGYDLSVLTIQYGQQHEKEIQSAKNISEALGISDHIFLPLNLSIFGKSTLFNNSKEPIKTNIPLKDIGKKIPPTYVPARNTIFLSLALAFAETRLADAIFIGVTAADYSGYPDCRPDFINAFQNLANLATKKTRNNSAIIIHTPLINDTKRKIIQKGNNVNVPFHLTWSCYQGKTHACGVCETCLLRLKGFQEANIADPLPYETYPSWYTQN